MDDKTYPANVAMVVDDALRPIASLKEILFRTEALETVNPSDFACVVESLLTDARRKLIAMQAPLEAEVGRVFFLHATVTNPDAETGEIVGVEVGSHG